MPATFKFLLGKNFHLDVRLWKRLVTELVIIIIIFTCITMDLKSTNGTYELDKEEASNVHIYDLKNIGNQTWKEHLNIDRPTMTMKLAYAPDTDFTKALMTKVNNELNLSEIVAYESDEDMENHFDSKNMLAGVLFNKLNKSAVVPEFLSVTLRFPSLFRTELDGPKSQKFWLTRCTGVIKDDHYADDGSQVDLYIQEGFIALQHAIFVEWYKNLTPTPPDPEIAMKSYRYEIDAVDCNSDKVQFLPVYLCYLAFLLPYLNLIRKYGRDMENKIIIHHWKYGYSHISHWRAHFIASFIRLLIHTFVILMVTRIHYRTKSMEYSHYPNAPLYPLFIFCVFFNCLLIVSAIIMVNIFRTVRTALLVAIAFWLGNFGLFASFIPFIESIHYPMVFVSFLISTSNVFPMGIYFLNEIDKHGDDIQHELLVMVVAAILLRIILLILLQIYWRDPFLEHKPINCFCLFEWYKMKKSVHSSGEGGTIEEASSSHHNYEFGPINGQQLVQVNNVTHFRRHSKKQQLKNISMRIFKGEITAIVGHHGAGKTTLLSILAGLRVPNMGSVQYDKLEVLEHWKEVRDKIDFNFTANPFYDDFTVEETLVYYLRVKMIEKDEQRLITEIIKWLDILQPIVPTKETFIKNLSYEQKRILMLCCILSCRTRIVILDEPTTHMRTKEQRYYWDILNKHKPDKAIVFTTIFMDEAEAIADRVAILHHGVLKAYGTPFFLRSKYGAGYDFIVLKEPEQPTEKITTFLKKYIPNAKPSYEMSNEVIYKLSSEYRPIFQNMLLHMEKDSATLGIRALNVTTTSLNDIYFEISRKKPHQSLPERGNNHYLRESEKNKSCMQIRAMLFKKSVQQNPTCSTILGIILSVILIFLMHHLSKEFLIQRPENAKIVLGLHKEKVLKNLFKQTDYNFIEVENLERHLRNETDVILSYSETELDFGYVEYEEHIMEANTVFNHFGAVSTSNTCYINQHVFHSAAIALNLAHNRLLQKNLNSSSYTVIVNKPMPLPMGVKLNRMESRSTHLSGPIIFGLVVPILISGFIIYAINDRRHHIWILQTLEGMHMYIYWFISILWDYIVFMLCTVIILLVIAFLSSLTFSIMSSIVVLIIFSLYGIAGLCMTYFLATILICTAMQAFLASVIIHLLTGLGFVLIYWDILEVESYFFYFASIFPTFNLLNGLGNIFALSKQRRYCHNKCSSIQNCDLDKICELIPICCDESYFQFKDPGVLQYCVLMIVSGLIFLMLTFWVFLHRKESKFRCLHKSKSLYTESYPYDDDDVIAIRKKLANMDMSEIQKYRFLVDQLENEIPKTGNGLMTISFAAHKSTCLAIYGGHNSGKTHLIQQLIGEKGFCFGDVFFNGKSIKMDLTLYQSIISYCPQHHGYIGMFTPKQLMQFFCMVRGVPQKITEQRIKDIEDSLDMSSYMNKKIKQLRPERIRKVNIALAAVSYHKIIFLDEPTRGLSSIARREIWTFLRYLRQCGKVIIITTSDSSEAEFLADNVVLMERGEMWAIGSFNHIQNKYTHGFYLHIKLKRDGETALDSQKNLYKDIENLNRFVSYLHEESELLSRNDTCVKFYCPVEHVSYSFLFGTLEKNKGRLNISDYIVSVGSISDTMLRIRAKRVHLN